MTCFLNSPDARLLLLRNRFDEHDYKHRKSCFKGGECRHNLPKESCDEFGALQDQVGKLYQVPRENKSSDTPDILTVEITMPGQETVS